MKRLLSILLLSISCFVSYGQSLSTQYNNAVNNALDSIWHYPTSPTKLVHQWTVGRSDINGYNFTLSAYDSLKAALDDSCVAIRADIVAGTGTVTSVSQGYGMINTPNPIVTTGSIKVDTTIIATRNRLQKYVDSLDALIAGKVNYTDTAGMLSVYRKKSDSNFNGGYASYKYAEAAYVKLAGSYADPAWISSLSWAKLIGLPTTLAGFGITNAYTKVESDARFAPISVTGSVTSVTAGAGLSGGTITTTGTISMPNTGTAGTYGSATQVPVFTTDAQGRVTSVTNTTITGTSPVGSSLLSGKFWVGNISNLAAAVAPSGDVTFDNAGAFAIGSGKVTNGMLAGSITASKLVGTDINTVGTITIGTWQGSSISTTYTDAKIKTVTGTSNRITIGGTSTDPTFDISTSYAGQATINTTGTITTGGAGTGFVIGGVTVTVGSDATGDIYYRNSSGILTRLGLGASTTVLHGGSSIPSYSQIVNGDIASATIDLTTKVTGILPSGNLPATVVYSTGATFTGGVIIPVLSVNNQTGTTYTFVLGDAGKEVTSNNASAVTFTVPTNASVAFLTDTYIPLENYGAGKLTIAAAGGVTINSDAGYLSITQYKGAYLHKIGTNTWLLIGGISN